MTCRDCIHYDICLNAFTVRGMYIGDDAEEMACFKNKADFVEAVHCGECKFTDDSCAYGLVCICEQGGMQGTIVSKRDYCSCGKRK